MKPNQLKIFGVVLLILAFVFGGVFYYASTKLRPEEIKKIAIEQTKKVFPNSEIELSKIDIDFGFNFKINLENFKMNDVKAEGKVELISVEKLVLNVPIWAILTNSGVVEIRLDSPSLNYSEYSDGNNWTHAMGGKENLASESKDETKNTDTSSESKVGLFGRSKVNVRLSDVNVKYYLRDNSKGEIKVSKFLIKGMNFEESTAFELQSNALFEMKDKSTVSFETLAIGQFNLTDYVKKGSMSSNVNIKVSKINKSGLDIKFPDVITDVAFNLNKEGVIEGKTNTIFEGQNKISSNFKIAKQIEINNVDVEIVLKDIANILGLDKSIDMSKSKLVSKGNLIYTQDKKIIPNFSFNISPGISYSKEGIVAQTIVQGEIKNKDLTGKAVTEVLDGKVISTINGEINLAEASDFSKMHPLDIKIFANGMKLTEKMIRSKLWDKKEKAEGEEDKTNTASSEKTPAKKETQLPPVKLSLEWNNINVGGEDFAGKGIITTSNRSIIIDNLGFKFSKGTGKLTQTMTLNANSSESKFNFEITNLNLNSFKAFLPPFVENFSGNFSGKLGGNATMFKSLEKAPVYDITVGLNATKGEIKKLNIGEYVNPMLQNIPLVKDQVKDKQIKVDGNFETFSLKGRFTNSQYSLNSFEFLGIEKKVQISGSGEIYPIGGKNDSFVEANFIDNTGKISEVLQKNTGSKILPMRLAGVGFGLRPDYNYTISKLAKGTMKTKGEEKLKEAVQKNIDKIVPEKAKEKVKGILNGLFK